MLHNSRFNIALYCCEYCCTFGLHVENCVISSRKSHFTPNEPAICIAFVYFNILSGLFDLSLIIDIVNKISV